MGGVVSATDTPIATRSLHEARVQLANTTKHIEDGTAVDALNARGLVEMGRVIAGSSKALRERAQISGFQCAVSPLQWDSDPLEAMRVFAEAGVPVSVCSMAIAGATAPGTMVGVTTLGHAEVLSGIAILETMVPGAKAVYVNFASTMDAYSGSLNHAWGVADLLFTTAQLARHVGLPCHGSGFGSGAKLPGWQSGAQGGMAALMCALSPGDLMMGTGGLYGSSVCYPPALLLDCELFDSAIAWAEGCSFDDDSFGLDVIDEVGPTGHFLASKHTMEHIREFWQGKLLDRTSWEEWEEAGRPDPPAVAEAEVGRILAEHQPEPLPEDVVLVLDRIVESFDREAAGG
jgi:trimethylamine--corrinoid protein Co-methyltransferase